VFCGQEPVLFPHCTLKMSHLPGFILGDNIYIPLFDTQTPNIIVDQETFNCRLSLLPSRLLSLLPDCCRYFRRFSLSVVVWHSKRWVCHPVLWNACYCHHYMATYMYLSPPVAQPSTPQQIYSIVPIIPENVVILEDIVDF
jgi:hypothetical protein